MRCPPRPSRRCVAAALVAIFHACPARAADQSWVCSPIAMAQDALPYVTASADAGESAYELATELDTCTATTCASPAADSVWCVEASCSTAAGDDVTYRDEATQDSGTDTQSSERVDLVVARATGPWTSLAVSRAESSWTSGSNTSSEATIWTVSYNGTLFDGWPADGAFTTSDSSFEEWGEDGSEWDWDDGTCAWRSSLRRDSDFEYWTVNVGDHAVETTEGDLFPCGISWATVDGAFVGAVDPSSWALDPADADADGFLAPDPSNAACTDCDDARPDVHPINTDIAGDGVDANCDGVDGIDQDGDGYASEADCNDRDANVHPGALDPCDGVDEDCDGVDDGCDSAEPVPQDSTVADSTYSPAQPVWSGDVGRHNAGGCSTVPAPGLLPALLALLAFVLRGKAGGRRS